MLSRRNNCQVEVRGSGSSVPGSVTSNNPAASPTTSGGRTSVLPNSGDLILSADGKTVTGVKNTDISQVVIPNGVSKIGSKAFEKCFKLQKVVLPQSVTSIGAHAFYDCKELEEMVLPSSIRKIGLYAIAEGKLRDIKLPYDVVLGEGAIKGVRSLAYPQQLKNYSVTRTYMYS